MAEDQKVPERTWVGGKCDKTIPVRGAVAHVGKFNEAHYPGVNFNPLICALCFDSKGEIIKLNKDGDIAKDGEEGIAVGREWYEHEFFQCCVDPESNATKCMCRCRENFLELEVKCPYYLNQVAETDPNDVKPIVQDAN